MKKGYLCLAILLVGIAGCGPKKKKVAVKQPTSAEIASELDIPVADESIKSFFDQDLGEFQLPEDAMVNNQSDAGLTTDFAWIEEPVQSKEEFKVIYFDFDKHSVAPTQETVVSYDAEQLKNIIKDQEKAGTPVQLKIVVEGHACHSSGSAIYNLALSEKRAKEVKDRLLSAGIPEQYIKIVGRGQEVPVMINGKQVTGSREEQWLNRRAEIHIIHV